ncbi:YihY/virulence factor BrkB family protein [Micromonospora eburnea]|uniref:Membrane protein n=1 Tax=Micromonospora eburnea TaxID=227316 RepID=A0A1C6VAP5_9ACTN|nr:membrane protein [Micromonospora eburnea]
MATDESSARSGSDRDDSGAASGESKRSGPAAPGAGPTSPGELPRPGWVATLKRTVREFQRDDLTDEAAALTYYAVLSIFPGVLLVVSLLGLLGAGAVQGVRNTVDQVVPEQNTRHIIDTAIDQAHRSSGLASLAAIFSLVGAFWAASRYISAFMRAANRIYDVPEGRPIWKTLPIRLGVTAVICAMLLAGAVIVVFTGSLAEHVGRALGLGSTGVTVWDIVKWPVLLVLVMLILAILYWASPNARHGGFRWVSPGGLLAVVSWLVVSALFGLYVTNFGSYNKTYGALAGVIIFLVWLWLTNIAVLFGAEFDAELERGRAIAAGHPPEKEPFVELRDDRKLRKKRGDRGPGR